MKHCKPEFRNLSLIIAIAVILLTASANAQPVFNWSKSSNGTGDESAKSVVTDNAGNVYMAGSFTGASITFGSVTIANSSANTSAFYIAKFDASGNAIWAKTANGLLNREAVSLDVDQQGNIYVAGHFESAILNFGSVSLANPNSPSTDIFLAKYDANGNFLWASSGTGRGYEYTRNVKTDLFGNVYINGWYGSDTLVMGGLTVINQGNAGTDHSFVAKYSSSGNILWMQTSYEGNNSDYATALTVDANGNAYLGGTFSSDTIRYGGYYIQNNSSGYMDVFLTKIDSIGNVLWLKSAGGSDNESLNSIAVDASGNVLITGSFYSASLPFGITSLANSDLSLATTDIYLAKYDSNGNLIWGRQTTGSDYDDSYAISSDNNGDIYIAGYFHSNALFLGLNTLTNASGVFYSDLFVAKYLSNGSVDWAIRAGGTDSDKANALCVSNSGLVHVCGTFQSTSIAFGSNTLSNSGAADAFLLSLSSTTGIENELSSNSNFQVYPNPVKDFITLPDAISKNVQSIKIYNNLGMMVYNDDNVNGKKNINVASLSSGLYYLKAYSNSILEFNSKVIVE